MNCDFYPVADLVDEGKFYLRTSSLVAPDDKDGDLDIDVPVRMSGIGDLYIDIEPFLIYVKLAGDCSDETITKLKLAFSNLPLLGFNEVASKCFVAYSDVPNVLSKVSENHDDLKTAIKLFDWKDFERRLYEAGVSILEGEGKRIADKIYELKRQQGKVIHALDRLPQKGRVAPKRRRDYCLSDDEELEYPVKEARKE